MMHVRELPPLRTSMDVQTPTGRRHRWAEDEPDPANVPANHRHSSTMPGGYESCDCVLPRKPGIDYSDLERLSTIQVLDASCDVISETRLERTPRVSGDQMSVSPSAVGWQAHLADINPVRMLYVDRGPSRWAKPSQAQEWFLTAAGKDLAALSWESSEGLVAALPETLVKGSAQAELWYRSPVAIGKVGYQGEESGVPGGWSGADILFSDDDVGTDELHVATMDNAIRYVTPTDSDRRYAVVIIAANGTDATPAAGSYRRYNQVAVYGNHDLTEYDIPGEFVGFLASDIVADVVARFAPHLNLTVGETIQPSSFVLPQAAYVDPTTVPEIIRDVTRFELQDWAVWEDRTFWWHQQGWANAPHRSWRARVGPAGLAETGPQVDRLWESIMVAYTAENGSTRTVGPPGSGADTETADLKDSDPENPANQLGITRRDLLTIGAGSVRDATQVGQRFLEETKLLDNSGRAVLVGHVEDDRGVLHAYHKVRAGDEITFVDAADPSPRRIVRAEHTRESRSCSVDLDAPPEGLKQLLERLGAGLVRA